MALEDHFLQQDLDEIAAGHERILQIWEADHRPMKDFTDWIEQTNDWFGFGDDLGAGFP